MIVGVLKPQRPAPKDQIYRKLVCQDDAFVLVEVIVELYKFA